MRSQMANKRDILKKYINAYSKYENESKDRLNELKRSFTNEKTLYLDHLDELNGHLIDNQNEFYNKIMTLHQDYLDHNQDIKNHFETIKTAFNQEVFQEMDALDQEAQMEDHIYDEILEDFELRKQDALDMYIKITKENNAAIDYDMRIHQDFIKQENQKLLKFKESYDNLSADLSNKMLWTIEKSKNAIEALHNQLDELHKDDLFSLNQQILKALSDMRGTRNDINVNFKETSKHLSVYKEEIYELRRAKQKPYSDINHRLIHKLIKQIRLANNNKAKYQTIIQKDLDQSLKKLYPHILKAYQEKKHDRLEKYILQTEILQEKAAFLIKKIEKITNYNISTYQKRIKEIKVETFSHNEEIKFTYAVPIKYIDHAISIYSNYNFYFNQGFNELDGLLSDFIPFTQKFNELRNRESLQIKDDLSSYQNNYLAQISKIANHLSSLLYNIDDIAFQISTLESKTRLEVSDIKKEIINVDIKGDYLKYLDTLSSDYELAKKEYKNRIKTINIKKMYFDKSHELYQTAIALDEEKEQIILNQIYQKSMTDIETTTHNDHYDYIKAHYDIYYKHQANMLDAFMQIVKHRLTQSLKASNYQLAKGYFTHANDINHDINLHLANYTSLKTRLNRLILLNNKETSEFLEYLDKEGQRQSSLNYLEKIRLQLNQQIKQAKNKKTKVLAESLLLTYEDLHQTNLDIESDITQLVTSHKLALYHLHKHPETLDKVIASLLDYRHILYVFTSSYYQTMSFTYQYHHLSSIDKLNNYYDDTSIDLIERSIRLFDNIHRKQKPSKRIKLITKYLIHTISILEKASLKFKKANEKTHESYIKPTVQQIALIEIDADDQKEVIEKYFDHLSKKSLRKRKNIARQKLIINKMTKRLNHVMEDQISYSHKTLKVKENQGQLELKNIHYKLTKIVNKNDKALNRMIKEINQMFIKQYEAMTEDYKDEIQIIFDLKTKVSDDSNIEKQYIDYINQQSIKSVQAAKMTLYRQSLKIPRERQARLNEVDQSRQIFFDEQQVLLNQKLAQLEKQKFITVPLLEKKIKEKESNVKDAYALLYKEHQSLEDNYLKQYTTSNQAFRLLHEGFQTNLVSNNLRYDDDLTQPLNDLLSTESSVINKVETIQKEISSQTKFKVEEVKKDKKSSQNKQERIIHS